MHKIERDRFESDKMLRRGRTEGFVFFAALLFLVFMAPGVFADQICSDCHNPTQHGSCDAGNCAACHGNPPVDAGGLIHPYANMPGPAASGSASAGAHARHATSSGMNYACGTCHYQGMSASSGQLVGGTNNGNGTLQMGFSIPMPGGITLTGGTYDGRPAPTYPYEGTNGTVITAGGTKTCSSIYCHSDGTSVSSNVIPDAPSPGWEAAGPLSCSVCHGYPPAYDSQYPKSNSHIFHVTFTCNTCHFTTTSNGTSITNAANHANKTYDVVMDPNATHAGSPVSFAYSFDPGGGQCSNVSCHGPVPNIKTWGGPQLTVGLSWSNGPACFEVQFTGYLNGIPPQVFNWDFGDGQAGTGETITHYYPHAGTYSVQLSALDSRNRRASTVQPEVTAKAVNILPVPDRTISVSGYTVTVTDFSTDPDYNTCDHTGSGTVLAQWGDSKPDSVVTAALTDVRPTTGRTLTHTYTTAGTYIVKHGVKDNVPSGYVYSDNQLVTVPGAMPSVRGKVLRLDGTTPVGAASVRLKLGTVVKKIATTSVAGSYTFTAVSPGSYTVEAVKSGLTFSSTPAAVVTTTDVTAADIKATR